MQYVNNTYPNFIMVHPDMEAGGGAVHELIEVPDPISMIWYL